MNRERAVDAYALDALKLVRLREENVSKRTELLKQLPSCHGRYAGRSSERALGRRIVCVTLSALGVRWTIDVSNPTTPADCNSCDPARRVRSVPGMDNGYAKLVDRDQEAADGLRVQRACVQRRTFHQQVGPWCVPSEPSNLCPQPPSDQGQMKIRHRLAFDQGEVVDRVVARGQGLDLHLPSQVTRASGTPLRRSWTSTTICMTQRCRASCHGRVTIQHHFWH